MKLLKGCKNCGGTMISALYLTVANKDSALFLCPRCDRTDLMPGRVRKRSTD